jgi:hypothetical protein
VSWIKVPGQVVDYFGMTGDEGLRGLDDRAFNALEDEVERLATTESVEAREPELSP